MNSPRLRFLTSADIRDINGATRRLVRVANREPLRKALVQEMEHRLPSELDVWSDWKREMDGLAAFAIPGDYLAEVRNRREAIETHIGEHPISKAIGWEGTEQVPRQMSDFISKRELVNNPLYCEALRHLDSNYQLVLSGGVVGETRTIISSHRKLKDFTEREREKLHLLGLRVFEIVRLLYERELIKAQITSIENVFSFNSAGFGALTASELLLLQRMLKLSSSEAGERRLSESERKTRRRIIEKLQLESSSHLFALLHRFKT